MDEKCTCSHQQLYHSSWGPCMVEGCTCKEYYPDTLATARCPECGEFLGDNGCATVGCGGA